VILLFSNYGSRFDTRYPPVFSSRVPKADAEAAWSDRLIHLLSWWWAIATRTGGIERIPLTLVTELATHRYHRQLAKQRWPVLRCEWGTRPALPEIVIGHRALDWTRLATDPSRCYWSGRPDVDGACITFDWSKIDRSRPLIYAGISTLVTKEKI